MVSREDVGTYCLSSAICSILCLSCDSSSHTSQGHAPSLGAILRPSQQEAAMSDIYLSCQPTRSYRPSETTIGVAAALGAVLIWAGWIVATRHAVAHALDPAAVGL